MIIYHDFLPTPRRDSHVKSDKFILRLDKIIFTDVELKMNEYSGIYF